MGEASDKASEKLRILVTGGAGYIGSVLAPSLLAAGHSVTVLDTFARGSTELADCCRYPGFQAVRGDARDATLVREQLGQSDLVIPLAAVVGAPACARDTSGAVSLNRDAIAMLMRNLGREQRIIFPTTNSGYGIGAPGEVCTEESELRPVSLYGRTKVEAEEAVLARGDTVTLRLATVFGMSPRMRLDLLVNDFVHRAVTDRALVVFEGHFRRNYIHVRDVAKAFQHGIEHYDELRGRPYNVGLSGANLSKIDLCKAIQQHVRDFTFCEAAYGEDPDKRDYVVSNARIEATGYRPDWSLDAGIAELVKGYVMLQNSRFSNA